MLKVYKSNFQAPDIYWLLKGISQLQVEVYNPDLVVNMGQLHAEMLKSNKACKLSPHQ